MVASKLFNGVLQRPEFARILHNSGWLLGDRVLRLAFGLFVGIVVARYLGPAQFGLLNYAIAFAALFNAFCTLGLDSIIVRDIVQNPAGAGSILGTTFALKFVGGIVAALSALGSILIFRPEERLVQLMVGIIAVGFIFQAVDAIDLWFQSQIAGKFTVLAKSIAFVLITIFRIYLVVTGAPLIAFAWAGLLETVLSALGLLVIYQRQGNKISEWRVRCQHAAGLLKTCWPQIVSGFAIMIYLRIGQVLLGGFSGEVAVGVYSAATRISELWYFVPIAIVSSVFPSIIAAKKTSHVLYYSRLQRLFNAMVFLGVSVGIVVSLFSDQIVILLYGTRFSAAGAVLVIHIWTGIFVGLGVAREPWIVSEDLLKFSLFATVAGALTAIICNLLLIPKYGAIGAALSTLGSQVVSVTISPLIYYRARRIFWMQLRAAAFWTWLK